MIAVAFSMPTTEARDLRTLFQSIDKDGSGKVDREEFCSYLRVAEPKMSVEEVNTLFDAIDQDGNQEISFLEFVASMVDSRSVNIGEINQVGSVAHVLIWFAYLILVGSAVVTQCTVVFSMETISMRRTKTDPIIVFYYHN